MSIACHWLLIVKFHDHHGLCGFMAHWDFIRWLLIRWCPELTPSLPGWQSRMWREDQLLLLVFPFCLSWCCLDVRWVYIDCGWSLVGRGDWHCISPLVMWKLVAFVSIISPTYFLRFISLGGMGNHFAILLVMDFTIWYTDIWIYVDCMSLIPDC